MVSCRRIEEHQDQAIIIVSGLPRSGTSMVMRMLEQGGLPLLTDNLRQPDEDNPKGYHEFDRVKDLAKGDTAWLFDAKGKAVKVITALLTHLPSAHTYKVLLMHRNMDEILASQRRMLVRRQAEQDPTSDDEMAGLFREHLKRIQGWMEQAANLCYLDLDYNAMITDPLPAATSIREFLSRSLDIEAMAAAVDPALYRQRAG